MKINYSRLGEIPIIEADNGLGLKVYFSSYGASIYAIYFDGKIMTLTPKNAKGFARGDIYYGKTIGAIAGRVKNGKVIINDKEYQITPNEGGNALHGGDYAVSKFLFAGKITNNNNTAFSIRYVFKKKKMKDGLPGNIEYIISYYLSANDNQLIIDLRAIPSEDTPISLTNHSYFCLGDENINNLLLTIPASKFISPDEKELIMKDIRDVNEIMDFRKKKPITRDINDDYLMNSRTKGYDHFFLLDDNKEPIILENSKYKLEITSDMDGTIIYSDNYEDGCDVVNTKTNLIHRAVAIEPEDSPLKDHIIKKGDMYHKQITYKFFKK